jgi:hypothetical protein
VLLSIGAAKKRRGISGNCSGFASIQGLRCPSQCGLNSSVHGTKRINCA